MNEKQVADLTRYAIELAGKIADTLFDEHAKQFGVLEESDRDKWTHGYCAGFSAGFVTAAMRADGAVKEAESKIPVLDPGVN